MLLNRLTRVLERARREEEGAALAAVIGLMATSLLLTGLIASSVVSSTAVTSSVRADVQSQAAAEAGVAAARAGLINGTCPTSLNRYASATGATPAFVATVWVPSGSSWVRGCPVLGQQARILSTGYASSPGVAGASAENQTSIEVVLSSVVGTTGIDASGPAIYSYSANGFGGSGALTAVNGSQPSVMVKTGSLDCGGAGSGAMSFVVESGALTIGGSCNIAGTAWASGRITHTGGASVGGNLVGAGVTMAGSSRVNGSIWSTSDLTMTGVPTIGGNVTAATMNVVGNINGNAWIYGSTTMGWTTALQGNLTTKTFSTPSSSFVRGTVTTTNPNTPAASPYATPTRPVVPNWVDFGYDKSKWIGFTEVVLTGAQCDFTSVQTRLSATGSADVLLDARNCGNFVLSDYLSLSISGDLAIISNKFNLGGSGRITASSPARLWLINPDNTADGVPTCAGGQQFSFGGSFSLSDNISAMMYSPCKIEIGSSTRFRGQVFAGVTNVAGAASIGYIPIGLPGVDLNTGATTAPAGSESNRTVLSSRNVAVGN